MGGPELQGGKPSRSFGGLVLLGALQLRALVVVAGLDRMATEALPDKPSEEDQNQSEN
ncbi:hypothetical protein ACFCX0_28400 [Streptomyces sp. NPDC056352]|uniref:hypothetical protein n=1 Tax=Streptomyces sp. NPDC056352 TaxID=3345791 RepID=UPI0035DC554D